MKLYRSNKIVKEGHLISKKDIFGIDYISKLANIGIDSLKIEGRGKTKEYISVVTRKYRKCIDEGKISKNDEEQLMQIFNRSGKSYGYFETSKPKESISYLTAKNTGLYLGKVLTKRKEYIKVKLEKDIDLKDGIESESGNISKIVTCIKDEKGKILNHKVESGNVVWLGDFKGKVSDGERINKTTSYRQIKDEEEYILKTNRKQDVDLDIKITEGGKFEVVAYVLNKKVDFNQVIAVEKAEKSPITKEKISESFNKNITESFNYIIKKFDVYDNIFIKISELNDIRRKISCKITEELKIRKDLKIDFSNIKKVLDVNSNKNIPFSDSLFIYKFKNENITNYNSENASNIFINIIDIQKGIELDRINKNIYLYIPNVVLKNTQKYIYDNIEKIINDYNVKGILIGNIGVLELCKKLKEKYNLILISDYSLNITNSYSALFYKNEGIDVCSMSIELDEERISKISKIIPIQIVNDYITVMTTRYCVINEFDGCNCKNEDYKLEDSYGNIYYIVTNDLDCTSKYVRKIEENDYKSIKCTNRKCIIS